MNFSKFQKLTLAVSLAFFFSMQYSTATVYTFTGNGNWSNILNWDGNGYPGTNILSGHTININGDCNLDTDVSSASPINVNLTGSFVILNGITLGMLETFSSFSSTTIDQGGNLTMGGTSMLDFSTGSFSMDGTLNNSGELVINNTLTLNISANGILNFETGATSDILGGISNNGTINVNGGNLSFNGTSTNNNDINIASGAFLTVFSGGTINNTSTAVISNSGTIVLNSSGSEIINTGSGSVSNSGTISGTGAITGPNITNNALGIISPGASPGCLTLGTTTTLGTIAIEVDGTTACSEHDQIQSASNIDLSGDLDVTINYTPSNGDQIVIIDASSISGTFSSDNLASEWSIAYNTPVTGEVSIIYTLLPVELSSFTVEEAPRNSGLLSWTTETELNNKGFEVERSLDGLDWKTLGFVDGKGQSVQTQHYEFQDRNPEDGTNYYRLKQVDFDGKTDYSAIRSLDFGNIRTNDLKVFPNPVDGREFTINLPELEQETGVLRVFDMKGNLKLRKEFSGIATNIKTENMNPGMYIIEVKIDGEKFTDKIIVK